jgi:hypothetical protein
LFDYSLFCGYSSVCDNCNVCRVLLAIPLDPARGHVYV